MFEGTITLPIVDCQLPIESIADLQLAIADWKTPRGCVTRCIAERKSAIGNRQSPMF